MHLGHESRGRGRFVPPVGLKSALLLVVASDAVDAALDQNEAELGVGILPVLLQVAADVHGLLDEVVQVLGQSGGNA